MNNTYETLAFECMYVNYVGSRDSSVGMATGWTARVRLRAVQAFSLLHKVQTGSGAHPVSCSMGTGDFPRGKAAGV
jgi:hypothetical protein